MTAPTQLPLFAVDDPDEPVVVIQIVTPSYATLILDDGAGFAGRVFGRLGRHLSLYCCKAHPQVGVADFQAGCELLVSRHGGGG
jgi:hypothetical protein